MRLGANVRRSLILPFRHQGAARIVAQLRVEDALAADNVAFAVLPTPGKIAVTLVSEGNGDLTLNVSVLEALGADTLAHGTIGEGGGDIIARLPGSTSVKAGDKLPLAIDASTAHLFDPASGKRI